MAVYLKLFLTAVLWGGTFISGRMLADHVPPCSAAFLRFAVATLLLGALLRILENGLPRLTARQIVAVVLLGLTGIFCYNIFFFKGLKLIPAGRASLIIATNPIFITLLAAFFFRERLSRIQGTGILLSVCGAVVVISKGDPLTVLNTGVGWGEVFIFGCVVSWVSFSLIGKAVLSGLTPLASITCASAVGTLALAVPAFSEGVLLQMGAYSAADWANILYLGVFGTVVGFIWYYQGIKAIGPSKAGLFINFVPISALTLAFFILKEPLTASLFIGAALVIMGVYLTNAPGLRSR